jgi:hypothetical protein
MGKVYRTRDIHLEGMLVQGWPPWEETGVAERAW